MVSGVCLVWFRLVSDLFDCLFWLADSVCSLPCWLVGGLVARCPCFLSCVVIVIFVFLCLLYTKTFPPPTFVELETVEEITGGRASTCIVFFVDHQQFIARCVKGSNLQIEKGRLTKN